MNEEPKLVRRRAIYRQRAETRKEENHGKLQELKGEPGVCTTQDAGTGQREIGLEGGRSLSSRQGRDGSGEEGPQVEVPKGTCPVCKKHIGTGTYLHVKRCKEKRDAAR